MSTQKVDQLLKAKDVAGLVSLVADMVNEKTPLESSKPVVNHLANNLSSLDNESCKSVAEQAITIIKQRQFQFDQEDTMIKKELAEVLSAQKQFERAARVLETILIDQSEKSFREKAEVWLMIAENWFEADDSVNAEIYVNKAAYLMHHLEKCVDIQLQYKNFHAKILDSKRQFQLAAWKYYSVSNQEGIEAEDAHAMLQCAVTCTVLSPVGDQKFRLVSTLHKDDRVKTLDAHYTLLDKLFMGQVIQPSDYDQFERKSLEEHQQVVGPDGFSCLQKAMLEHNILVLSNLYLNISFTQLGEFLNIPPTQAEAILADMISQHRIRARMDQRANLIEFDVETGAKVIEVAGAQEEKAAKASGKQEELTSKQDREMSDLNNQIHSLCSNVDSLIQDVLKVHPDLQKYDTHYF